MTLYLSVILLGANSFDGCQEGCNEDCIGADINARKVKQEWNDTSDIYWKYYNQDANEHNVNPDYLSKLKEEMDEAHQRLLDAQEEARKACQ